MKSKKYPNLHKYPASPYWVFRKFSKEKGREFVKSTKEPKDEARAYKIGVELFNDWLGAYLPDRGRNLLIKDIARAVLAAKEARKGGKFGHTYKSARNEIMNHIVPAFGHLRPDQITPIRWQQYDADERRKLYSRRYGDHTKEYRRKHLSGTRKLLIDVLLRAHEAGAIRKVPKLKNFDPKPAPPRYIRKETVLKIIRLAHRSTKLWVYIMWKQGPRPSECLQYRWDMIHWGEGPTGAQLAIPAEITKTNRARTIPLNPGVIRILRRLESRSASDWIFPAQGNTKKHMTAYKTGWNSARARAKVDFDPYNLRDTFITDCLKQGLSSTFIGRYCDNSPVIIDSRYAVAEQDALALIAKKGGRGNVQ